MIFSMVVSPVGADDMISILSGISAKIKTGKESKGYIRHPDGNGVIGTWQFIQEVPA